MYVEAEEEVSAQWPSVLARLCSLQVLRVCKDEMLHMPKGTVHMVVSTDPLLGMGCEFCDRPFFRDAVASFVRRVM